MLRAKFLFDVVLPALMLCWAALLFYNAVASDTGYRALSAIERDVDLMSEEVDALQTRRLALERRADLLSSKSLDPDLVDERIRSVLGFAREGEVVIPRREMDKLLEVAPAK